MKMSSIIELDNEDVMKAVTEYASTYTGFDITPHDIRNIFIEQKPDDTKESLFPSISFQFDFDLKTDSGDQ